MRTWARATSRVLLRVVERRARGVALAFASVDGAIEGLLRVQQVGLRLGQRFARRRQRQLLELAHPRLGLGDARPAPAPRPPSIRVASSDDQRLALDDPLAFLDQHVLDGAGDLAPISTRYGVSHMAAGDHRLDQIAPRGPDRPTTAGPKIIRAPCQPPAMSATSTASTNHRCDQIANQAAEALSVFFRGSAIDCSTISTPCKSRPTGGRGLFPEL